MRAGRNRRPGSRAVALALALLGAVVLLLVWAGAGRVRQAGLDRALVAAVRRYDSRAVARLLAEGADPNAHEHRQFMGNVDFLTALRMLVNPRLSEGRSVAEFAVWTGDLDSAQILLEHGARLPDRPVAPDQSGRTPLMLAARRGHAGLARALLRRGANPNARDWIRATPLMYAAGARSPECVDLLLAGGADVNARDKVGRTVLLAAAHGRSAADVEAARSLLEHGADARLAQDKTWSPLMVASRFGSPSMVKLLLAHGAAAPDQARMAERALLTAVVHRRGDTAAVLKQAGVRETFTQADVARLRQVDAQAATRFQRTIVRPTAIAVPPKARLGPGSP